MSTISWTTADNMLQLTKAVDNCTNPGSKQPLTADLKPPHAQAIASQGAKARFCLALASLLDPKCTNSPCQYAALRTSYLVIAPASQLLLSATC